MGNINPTQPIKEKVLMLDLDIIYFDKLWTLQAIPLNLFPLDTTPSSNYGVQNQEIK